MIETSLVARLAPITTNLYPAEAPKDYSLPVVVYNRSDTVPAGDLSPGTKTAKVWLQLDIYDQSYLGSKTLAETIRQNLEVWTDDGVMAVSWTGEHDAVDDTTETTLYRTLLSFTAWVRVD